MKQFERLMRGAHDGLSREVPKEIYQLAAQHATIARDEVASLYVRALKQTRPDSPELRYEFLRLLKEAHPPRKRIAPTKRTLTAALYGDPNRWAAPKPGVSPGGKRTRTMTLKEELAKRKRYLEMRAYFAEAERTGTPVPNEVKFPHYREVMKLLAANKEKLEETAELATDATVNDTGNSNSHNRDRTQRNHRRTSLPPEVQRHMAHAFGLGFADVEVYPGSDKASGNKHAVTTGRQIHFAPGKYTPGTPKGDWLIGHELAHTVQQRGATGTTGQPASTERGALETEADRAADAALAGRRAPMRRKVLFEDVAPPTLGPKPTTSIAGVQMHPAKAVTKRLVHWLMRSSVTKQISKHVAKHGRDIAGKAVHSVFKNPNKIRSMVRKAAVEANELAQKNASRSADEILEGPGIKIFRQNAGQGKYRWIVEREFKNAIGKNGEKVLKIVVDYSGRVVTAYPARALSVIGLSAGSIGVFDSKAAEAGERIQNAIAADVKQRQEKESSWSSFIVDLFTPLLLTSSPLNDGEALWLTQRNIIRQFYRDLLVEIEASEQRSLTDEEQRQLYELLTTSIGSGMLAKGDEQDGDHDGDDK